MTENDYVTFCNFAFGLRKSAEAFCADLGEEQVRQLHGFVQNEIAATAAGQVEPAYDFLAAILAEDVASRDRPASEATSTPNGGSDGLPI